jgi:DNA-binding response OmpR family regulator
MKVLIVDDDLPLTRVLARLLERCGHGCVTAPTAELALRTLIVARPSMAMVDLELGGGSQGIDLVTWIRSGLRLPVVAMTRGDVNRARLALTRAGLDEVDVLHKPFSLIGLLTKMAEYPIEARAV